MPWPTLALPLMMLLAPPAGNGANRADATPSPRVALRAADCLSPASVRSWHYVDSRELLVDAGRRKYRVTLSESCTELGGAASIGFRGDSVSGRVCGHFGDQVLTRGAACRIERVALIDGPTWREATGTPKASVSAGAEVR